MKKRLLILILLILFSFAVSASFQVSYKMKTTDNGATWGSDSIGVSVGTFVEMDNGDLIAMVYDRSTQETYVAKSTDKGNAWSRISGIPGAISAQIFKAKLGGIERLYLLESSINPINLYESLDKGVNWEPIWSKDFGVPKPNAKPYFINGRIFINTYTIGTGCGWGDAKLFSSSKQLANGAGYAYNFVSTTPIEYNVEIIAPKEKTNGTLFGKKVTLSGITCTSGGLYKSDDNGNTWSYLAFSGSIVNNVVEESNNIFVGTSAGISKGEQFIYTMPRGNIITSNGKNVLLEGANEQNYYSTTSVGSTELVEPEVRLRFDVGGVKGNIINSGSIILNGLNISYVKANNCRKESLRRQVGGTYVNVNVCASVDLKIMLSGTEYVWSSIGAGKNLNSFIFNKLYASDSSNSKNYYYSNGWVEASTTEPGFRYLNIVKLKDTNHIKFNVASCVDGDGDNYAPSGSNSRCGLVDCDDTNNLIKPGNVENTVALCTDAKDNDCDGKIDYGITTYPTDLDCPVISCNPTTDIPKQCGTTDIGECGYGTQSCQVSGTWGNCIGNVEPVNENTNAFCSDAKDNDCDTKIDCLDKNCITSKTANSILADNCKDEDYDGDGLTNEWEELLNLDPTLTDTDGDGITDDDEDTDGDGYSNIDEINAGTDPTSSGSYPLPTECSSCGNGVGNICDNTECHSIGNCYFVPGILNNNCYDIIDTTICDNLKGDEYVCSDSFELTNYLSIPLNCVWDNTANPKCYSSSIVSGCGNGVCEMDESIFSCSQDCGCPAGKFPQRDGSCALIADINACIDEDGICKSEELCGCADCGPIVNDDGITEYYSAGCDSNSVCDGSNGCISFDYSAMNCLEIGGELCASGEFCIDQWNGEIWPIPFTTTNDAAETTCCAGANSYCGEIVTTVTGETISLQSSGQCVAELGQSEGKITFIPSNGPSYTEPCTVSLGKKIPFYDYLGVFLTLGILVGYYLFKHKRK